MSARLVKQQLNSLLSGGLLAASEPKQGRAIGTATKSVSKVQKQATKERLRQKRKRIAAAAAAAADGTEDAETVKERNLRYFVATAKADAEVKKLMRELLGGQRASDNQEPEETDEDLADLFG